MRMALLVAEELLSHGAAPAHNTGAQNTGTQNTGAQSTGTQNTGEDYIPRMIPSREWLQLPADTTRGCLKRKSCRSAGVHGFPASDGPGVGKH